jgi:creatinine amidohydrolase
MIGPLHTTFDWQLHTGTVCVCGIGAFEQHSHHLPLDTDGFLADYFATFIAEELNAALLPSLHIGTSLEQTGYRGTVTLRPETLMLIIRDIAEEIEHQHFTRMILVNAHGGNHCLVPVVRDINRQNRPLKILLVNYWEFVDADIIQSLGSGAIACHADAFETSLMLAIAPELVRPTAVDITLPADDPLPFRQSDLTTFGVGLMSPHGSGGFPSRANSQVGEQILSSIKENVSIYLRDRLERLDRQPRYSGTVEI